MKPVSIGFQPHSGWAAYSVVRGSLARPELVDRGRVELIGDDLPGMAYHAAQGLPIDEAQALVDAAWESAQTAADTAIAELTADADADAEVDGVVIIGSPRELPPLERILKSHTLLHTAEGAMFVTVLAEAAERAGLQTRIVDRGALPPLGPAVAELGKALGPPWRKDHKQAALAALAR